MAPRRNRRSIRELVANSSLRKCGALTLCVSRARQRTGRRGGFCRWSGRTPENGLRNCGVLKADPMRTARDGVARLVSRCRLFGLVKQERSANETHVVSWAVGLPGAQSASGERTRAVWSTRRHAASVWPSSQSISDRVLSACQRRLWYTSGESCADVSANESTTSLCA